MRSYILKRIGVSLITVILVSMFAFSLLHVLPGDPVALAIGEGATPEEMAVYREKFNLNKPLIEQYFIWIKGILTRGDFGKSILFDENVTELIKARLPVTFSIGIPSLILGVFVGLTFGIICAVKRGSWLDQMSSIISNFNLATPTFWIAILGVYLLSVKLHLIPLQGYTAPSVNFGQYVHKAIWPVICGSFGIGAVLTRQTRSNMLEVINQDYVRTARANGLSERRIILGHTLKNALIPVVTIIGTHMRTIVGGSVVIERIFNIPGVGQLLMRAISDRDYFIVVSCVLMISIVTVACNLLVDIAYGIIDPRVRRGWK